MTNEQLKQLVRELIDVTYETGYYSGKGEDGQPHHIKAIKRREKLRHKVYFRLAVVEILKKEMIDDE